MRKLRNLFITVLLLIPLTVVSVMYFKTLDSRNRLNSSQISSVLKDSRGFVWCGPAAGPDT